VHGRKANPALVRQVDKSNLASLDLDHDGVISREELIAAMKVHGGGSGGSSGRACAPKCPSPRVVALAQTPHRT
jgi:hypothetical protein